MQTTTAADRDELTPPADNGCPSLSPADAADLASLWLDLGGSD
jgi:hypothetical protein